jgi:hypothetical protein
MKETNIQVHAYNRYDEDLSLIEELEEIRQRPEVNMPCDQFARHLGISQVAYYEARRGNKPGRKLLDGVLRTYPDLQLHVLRNMLYWVRKENEDESSPNS